MGNHLPNAPLIEAILEVQWKLTELAGDQGPKQDPAYPIYTGIFYSLVRDQFGHIERLPATDVPDELTPHVVKQRFRMGEGQWPLMQLGPGVASMNFTSEYRWDDFQAMSRRFYSALIQSYASANREIPPALKSITLRYINSVPITVLPEGLFQFLGQHLHVPIKLPEAITTSPAIAGSPAGFQLHVDFPISQPDGSGVLRFSTGSMKTGEPVLLWELIVDSKNKVPQDQTEFDTWLTQAHAVCESWFLALVEGRLLERFREG